MAGSSPDYGLWLLAAINAAVFIIFAFSFTKLQTKRDWRSFGAFAGFIVALFAEMYGFPLTIYLLSGWLGSAYPTLDPFSHDAGHLWSTLLGLKGDPHTSGFHVASFALVLGGFWLLTAAWRPLYGAQRRGELATDGVYARIRHPQYAGFILIMFGFLLQWPTLLTLIMFPVLVFMYVNLARHEEKAAIERFGATYLDYMQRVPSFLPRLTSGAAEPAHHPR
ncbi:MAG: isoprenylcysteine carboxylmethyltransferase family protein [Proteobacteria bacterium]|nr:isoprenylcysteine carboxylmethyltransferase family protein [Pseudomonadota bacterium]